MEETNPQVDQRLLQLKELAKIMSDTPYALRTYLETYDNTQKKFVPFALFEDQIKLIKDLEAHNENITKKYRQAGVTTVVAGWLSKKLQLADEKQPERVLICANKRDTAIEMATKIKDFLYQWPEWVNVGFDPNKNSESRYRLLNGCEVKAVASSKDALRGYTPTILVFDEAAYIEAGEDFWAASMAALSTGGKVILISTPNGFDPIYHSIYDQAIRKLNDFKITELTWYHDPRYAKDLRWLKVDDTVDYMLNRGKYDDDEITVHDVPREKYSEMIEQGYKPYSSWYERMAKKFKYDKRRMSQELECDFLGSGDSVIPKETVERIKDKMLREPIEKYMGGEMWQWKEPVEGHRYIMGIDVSRGDSDDASAINIIDFDEQEQVLEYVGKIPPDDLASVAYKWALFYRAFVVIDITGGMGVATARKLQELGYRDLFYDGVNTKDVWVNSKKMKKIEDKIPGINFNNKRTQIVAAFEESLRHGMLVRSIRLVNEINTFVYLNGRPDHMKGYHDDSIMSIAIALYAGDICFTQLKRNEAKNRAMLESWVSSEKTYDTNKAFYSYGSVLDAVGSMATQPNEVTFHDYNPMDVPKNAYREYGWLFGKPPEDPNNH